MKRYQINLNNYQYICEYYKNGIDFKDENYKSKFTILRNFEIYNDIIYDKDIFFIDKKIADDIKNNDSTNKLVYPIHDIDMGKILKFSNLGEMFNYYNISSVKDFIYNIYVDKENTKELANIKCDKIRIYNPTIQKNLDYIIHIDNFINDIHFHYLCNLDNNYNKKYEKEFVFNNSRYVEFIELMIPNIEYLFNEDNKLYFEEDFNIIKGTNSINDYYNNRESEIIGPEYKSYTLDDIIRAKNDFISYNFKYEDIHNEIISNFESMTSIELSSFNDFNIIPYKAYFIGIYKNGEKKGLINVIGKRNSFGDRKYRVGLMTDIHYNDSTIDNDTTTITTDASEYEYDLYNALDLYQTKEDVDFICATGDISSNDILHILNFKKTLNEHAPSTNFYSCLGNHDFASIKNENIPENEIGYDIEGKTPEQVWNDILTPNNSKYELHYQDETIESGKTSYWFEVPIEGTSKSDIYIFLSVNYDNNDSTASVILNENSPYIQDLIDYVGFMPSKYNIQFYDNKTLIWLKSILEQYSSKRIFIFTHLFFVHKAGSNNGDNSYYHYGGVGDRWRMGQDSAYCLCGIQFEFLNKLNNEYKNTIWFTGHSHSKWNWQNIDQNININNNEYRLYRPDDNDFVEGMHYLRKSNTSISKTGFNVHLPSTSRPLKIDRSYCIANGDSEGAIMDIYEDYVDIRGIIFKNQEKYPDIYINKYYPLAQYRINIKAS